MTGGKTLTIAGEAGAKFLGTRPVIEVQRSLVSIGGAGWGLNYTIQRFTPALTGRKECRGTLFPASVTREIGG